MEKEKCKIHFSLPSSFRPAGLPSAGLFLPAAQLASPLAPRSAQRQPPAARLARPSKPRRPSLTRATAAASSSRPQPLTARPRVSAPSPSSARLGNRPRERLSNRRPRSWRRGSIPPLLGLDKKKPSPPAHSPTLPTPFSLSRSRLGGHNRCTEELRRPPSSPPRETPSPSRVRLRLKSR